MRWWFLFVVSPLFGAYIGNPASPGIMDTGIFSLRNPFIKATTGYIADYTSDKRFVASEEDPSYDPDQAFRKFGLHSQLASFSLILLERLEIFGTAGGTKERAKWHEPPPSSDPTAIFVEFSSKHHFSWSAGAKVILVQWGQTFLCGDFTYFAIPSSPKAFFKFFNRLDLPLDLEKQKFHLHEWQASGALASRFFFLTPYAGLTYLRSQLDIASGTETEALHYHNEERWGYFYGLTLSLTGRFHLTAEKRLRSENAYTFSTTAVF